MKWNELSNKKVGLWGMGREGQSTREALLKHVLNVQIVEISEDRKSVV